MRYRTLGKTGLPFSIFSAGTRRLLSSLQGNDPGRIREQVSAYFEKALSRGINNFLLAPASPDMEKILGNVLQSLPRKRFHLTLLLDLEASIEEIANDLEPRLDRLGQDCIEVAMLHGLNTADRLRQATCPNGYMKAVEDAKTSKRIQFAGFTSHGSLDLIIRAMNTELFDAAGFHYGYFHQRYQTILDQAGEMRIGVMILSPSGRGGRFERPPRLVREICAPHHPMTVNHRFILQHPSVTTLALSAQSWEDFAAWAPAFDNDGPLSDSETVSLAQLDVRRLQLPNSWCIFCHECLPCPEDVNIPEMLRLRNMALAYNLMDYAREYHARFGQGDSWFPGNQGEKCTDCGDCIPRCPERLDIPKLLRETQKKLGSNTRG